MLNLFIKVCGPKKGQGKVRLIPRVELFCCFTELPLKAMLPDRAAMLVKCSPWLPGSLPLPGPNGVAGFFLLWPSLKAMLPDRAAMLVKCSPWLPGSYLATQGSNAPAMQSLTSWQPSCCQARMVSLASFFFGPLCKQCCQTGQQCSWNGVLDFLAAFLPGPRP